MLYKELEYYKGVVCEMILHSGKLLTRRVQCASEGSLGAGKWGGYFNYLDLVPEIFLIILNEGLLNKIKLHIFITPSPAVNVSV